MKGLGETQTGFFVGVTNLPKKKNVFRETLKLLLKKNMIDRSDVEEVAEDNLESVNSSVSYSDESSELIVEKVWRQFSRFQENTLCIKNVEVKSDGVISSSLKRQRTAIAVNFGHVYIKPVTDKLEEFRKASIAYVVMPLDDNTFQVAAASGNDVWIVRMSDCTICTCGDFQRCTR
ncbi:hypothetical protein Bca4012_049886 [Brassica carinata]|uniref:Uncharacterized protein n=1 Tax=Brassica carinata TaxID=52824 RepID=A0A8X7R4U4_BRACI|nr:hypothetical protein Bca52824_052632 [Brassica carinata]